MQKLKCPCCQKDLIVVGKARLETGLEHVLNPNGQVSLKDKYVCPDKSCPTQVYDVFWNGYGEKYSTAYRNGRIKYINDNDAPFGSFERKINVEVRKDDENIKWSIGKYTLELDWKYTSNFDGDVLSKKPSFKLWIDNTLYISGMRMLLFSLRQHFSLAHKLNKREFLSDFEYPKYEREKKLWWRWVAPFLLRILDNKNYTK